MPGARKRLNTECGARDTTEHGIKDGEDGGGAIYVDDVPMIKWWT